MSQPPEHPGNPAGTPRAAIRACRKLPAARLRSASPPPGYGPPPGDLPASWLQRTLPPPAMAHRAGPAYPTHLHRRVLAWRRDQLVME